MSKVIDLTARAAIKSPWLIYVGRLSEGEKVECNEDGSIMIYTESLDRIPFLIEKGKELIARKRAARPAAERR